MLPITAHVVTEHSRTFQASSLVALAASSFFAGDMSMQLMVKGLVRRLGGFRLLWMGTFAWSFALLLVPLALAADFALKPASSGNDTTFGDPGPLILK